MTRKKDKRERARNPVKVSDRTKRLLEREKTERAAESFDEAIRGLIQEADAKDDGDRFMQF